MNLLLLPEIFIYEIFDFLPNLTLAYIPFCGMLRLSKRATAGFAALLFLLISFTRLTALNRPDSAAFLSVLWAVLYLAFYFFGFRAGIARLLFVLLLLLNYGSFVVVLYSYFACHVFLKTVYSSGSIFILAFIMVVSYPFMYLMMKHRIRPLVTAAGNDSIWRLLWIIPGIFCLSYYYNIYAAGGILAYSGNPANVIFAVAFNAGAMFASFIAVRLVEENILNMCLRMENYQLNLQTTQYENLKGRMEEARRARHDLRQALTVIQSYLADGDSEGLSRYVEQYTAALPSDAPIIYCGNYALNALIVYYREKAERADIAFGASVDCSAEIRLADSDLTVLFGNLIENALEACERQREGRRFMKLRIRQTGEAIVATLDNSYSGTIARQDAGFVSSKNGRTGIGIDSVQRIVSQYGGTIQFHYDGSEFQASLLLYPQARV